MSADAKPQKVAVLGGGPWGVALALAAKRAGSDVVLRTRRAARRTR